MSSNRWSTEFAAWLAGLLLAVRWQTPTTARRACPAAIEAIVRG